MTGRAALFVSLVFAAAPGCSSASPGPSESCRSFDYATYAAGPKHVSFKSDVVPIFGTACAFSACHAAESNPMGGLYLGPNVNNTMDKDTSVPPFYPPDDATLAKIHGGLVDVKAKLALTMLLVHAGSPKDSFLMHKIDGDQGCAGIACNPIDTGTCGEAMPQRSASLDPGASTAIRDWIAQGATNE
jgi:hypothetical protein